MNYFILTQDERIPHTIEPIGMLQTIKHEWLTKERVDEVDKLDLQFKIKEQVRCNPTDFIEKPLPLFSDRFKKLIEKYVPNLPMKAVVLLDETEGKQLLYWLMIPPAVACLSTQSEFHLDGASKKLVLEEDLAASYPIFTIEGVRERIIIVNIALAESMLRRQFYGIGLQKIVTNGRWNDLLKLR